MEGVIEMGFSGLCVHSLLCFVFAGLELSSNKFPDKNSYGSKGPHNCHRKQMLTLCMFIGYDNSTGKKQSKLIGP